MKLKHLLVAAFALSALTPTFTACSSDDEPTTQGETISKSIPDEFVAEWDFNGFTLSLGKEEGSIFFDNGSNLASLASRAASYKTFTYSYDKSKKELVCTSDDGSSFTLKNIQLDSNGNLQVTHSLTGAEKTETATKHVADVYTVPDEFVGSWDFDDFRLTIDKKAYGVLVYSNGSNLARSTDDDLYDEAQNVVFTYSYNEAKNVLKCETTLHYKYTISNLQIGSDGKLTITHNFQGTTKVVSGTKHTYAAVTKDQLLGAWSFSGVEFLSLTNDKAKIYEEEEGTWRVDGSTVYVTIDGKEIAFLKNVEVNGNTMNAHVYSYSSYWKPYTLTRSSSDTSDEINIKKIYDKTWVWQELGNKMSLTFKANGQGTCVTVDEDGTETSSFAWSYNPQTHVMTITDDEGLNGTMKIKSITDDEMQTEMTIVDNGEAMTMAMNFFVQE